MRFIYLVEKPFSKRDARRFGVETVIANGFEAEAWDVGLLCAPQYPRDSKIADTLKITVFGNFSDLKSALKTLSPDDVILGLAGMSIDQAWPYRRLRAAVFNTEVKLATITNGHSPFDRWDTLWDKLKNLIVIPGGFLNIARRIVQFIINELKMAVGTVLTLLNRRKLDYVFAGASVLGVDKLLVGKKTKVINIHSLDADALLEVESKPIPENDKYIVYLDSMGPLHPELTAYQLAFGREAPEFFSSNLRCLVYLQKKLSKPCVVAAHPRAEQGQLDEYFSPYKVYHHQTPDLVANSVCVVAEPSMSLGMAAWFNKPAIILSHNDLAEWNKQMIDDYRDALGCAVWDVTDDSTWLIPKIDEERYENYRSSYLKQPGSIMKPFWQVVSDELLQKQIQ